MRHRAGRSYWLLLLVLAAIWGASYLFIKLAVRDIEPTVTMCARSLIAAALLVPYLLATLGRRGALAQLRGAWRESAVLGAINAAIPFTLVAWGEKHIDSSVAGIAQATVPLFSFVIGLQFLSHERVAPCRWFGIALGIAGVAVLAGLNPRGGWWAVAGTLAVVVSSVSYASGGIYGAILLDEPVTTSAVAGLALILAGVALGSGVLRHVEREAVGAPAGGR